MEKRPRVIYSIITRGLLCLLSVVHFFPVLFLFPPDRNHSLKIPNLLNPGAVNFCRAHFCSFIFILHFGLFSPLSWSQRAGLLRTMCTVSYPDVSLLLDGIIPSREYGHWRQNVYIIVAFHSLCTLPLVSPVLIFFSMAKI